jgi:hypothetical protein
MLGFKRNIAWRMPANPVARQQGLGFMTMKMILTAGLLSAALLLAVLNTVQAHVSAPAQSESVTPITAFGE